MASDNETVEQVCSVLYTYPKAEVCDGSVLTVLNNDKIADRILAAHKREITAKDDERLTIVAMYENVIADKDAVIAELERRLKVAEKFAAEMKESTNSLVRACGHQMILRLQGEGAKDESK